MDYLYLDRATLWNGEAFAGRQLLITLDQGLGDAIQMVRYLPAVKARGGRVILEVRTALVPQFAVRTARVPLFPDLPGGRRRVTGGRRREPRGRRGYAGSLFRSPERPRNGSPLDPRADSLPAGAAGPHRALATRADSPWYPTMRLFASRPPAIWPLSSPRWRVSYAPCVTN
jgi:hypothetical protein